MLTIEGYSLKEEHEAHEKREAVSPFGRGKQNHLCGEDKNFCCYKTDCTPWTGRDGGFGRA